MHCADIVVFDFVRILSTNVSRYRMFCHSVLRCHFIYDKW